jgi:hypothetical protein
MRSQLAWQDNCLLTADSSFSFPSSTKSNFLGTAAQEHFCTGKKVSHELSIDQNYGISRSALGRARCPCSNRVTGVKTKTLCASPRFESIGIQSATLLRPFERAPIKPGRAVLSRASKKRFLLLSAAVYGAALADMHRTLEVRKNSWWYETDPLAKPFVRLPTPAYYVTGLAMATGLNWLSWKMAHSGRWHRLAPIPQLLSIGGNLYGFQFNRF